LAGVAGLVSCTLRRLAGGSVQLLSPWALT